MYEISSERRHALDHLFQLDPERIFFQPIRCRDFQSGILEQTKKTDRFGRFVFEYMPEKFFFHVSRHRLECRRAAAKFLQLGAQFCDALFLAGFIVELYECHVWLLKVRG